MDTPALKMLQVLVLSNVRVMFRPKSDAGVLLVAPPAVAVTRVTLVPTQDTPPTITLENRLTLNADTVSLGSFYLETGRPLMQALEFAKEVGWLE